MKSKIKAQNIQMDHCKSIKSLIIEILANLKISDILMKIWSMVKLKNLVNLWLKMIIKSQKKNPRHLF